MDNQDHKKQPIIFQKQFNYKALLIACRVALTFIIILLTNRAMGWSFVDIQAIIAGVIVSAQHSVTMTHQRAFLRLLGVIGGALLAILFAYVLRYIPSPWLMILLITLSLSVLTLCCERYRFWEYAFLQAGVMIPLILMTSNQIINVHLAIERSLGSLEGALIAIVMVYVSHLFFTKKMREQ